MRTLLLTTFLLTAICSISNAQMKDTSYQQEWKAIDALITEKGLPKSALASVNKLLADARRNNLPGTVLKALVYRMSLEQMVEEDDNSNQQVAALQQEINAATDPVQQSLLRVILAARYQDYFNNYGWRIYGRSTTTGYTKNDIATWSAADFSQAISLLYLQALQPAALLQQTSLNAYLTVIIRGTVPHLRPTLYDLVAHKALDYFKQQNRNSLTAEDAFEIIDAAALADAGTFMSSTFTATDSTSHTFLALHLFRQLLLFHQQDKDPAAFIDVDIERISWVHDICVIPEKDQLYMQALAAITQYYPDHPQAAQAWYLQAAAIAQQADGYDAFGDTTHRYAKATARKLIVARLAAQPAASEGNSNMQQLLDQINETTLHTQVENINTPGKPFRMLVQYKNTGKLYLRLLQAGSVQPLISKNNNNREYWKELSTLPYLTTFTQQLPATDDHLQHAVEIKVDALQPGSYAMLVSTGASFNDSTDRLSLQLFDVSQISCIQNGADFFLADRETGYPLDKVKVTYATQRWDYRSNNFSVVATGTLYTDKNGFFTLKEKDLGRERSLVLKFDNGKDSLTLRTNQYYAPVSSMDYQEDTDNPPQEIPYLYFFTDRGIYRPGQTVYFKGIGVLKQPQTGKSRILESTTPVTLQLRDANNQVIDSITVPLSGYGSVQGKFTLPQKALTGHFSISADKINGAAGFSVEAYKRPTFFIAFDTLKSGYRLGDTITVSGVVSGYAGNALNGARVRYTVQRKTRYLYPWMFQRGIWPSVSSRQITRGTIIAGADGKFSVNFPATPDMSVSKSTDPVFDFVIEVDVTAGNGETRNAATSVAVAYTSMQLKLMVPEKIANTAFTSIPVTAANLAGQAVAADVTVTVYPLKTPGKIYRERYWQQPDQYVMDQSAYEGLFPYDAYASESEVFAWERKTAILQQTISTGTTATVDLHQRLLPQGWYAIEATATDKDGNTIKDTRYAEVYDPAAKALPALQSNWSMPMTPVVQPGDTAKLLIATSEKDLFIYHHVKKGNRESGYNEYRFINLNNGSLLLQQPTGEADRKGLGLYYAFIRHNRLYTGGIDVQIPYREKELALSYSSYRDKTLPGSKETWTVTVKGSKGEPAATELLTAMYDASLDQFMPFNWNRPDVWPSASTSNSFDGTLCFNTRQSDDHYTYNEPSYFDKRYDAIATSGEDFTELNSQAMYQKREMLNAPVMIQANAAGKVEVDKLTPAKIAADEVAKPSEAEDQQEQNKAAQVQPRKNLNETAFFFPQLYTDSTGNTSFSFTMPEALTTWKWISIAHTRNLDFGLKEQQVITSKPLMVQPSLPRFVREGDRMEMIAMITNLGDSAVTGTAEFKLLDGITLEPVDGLFQNVFPQQYFTAEAGQGTAVRFPLTIPFNYTAPLTIQVIARAGNFSDGEENTVPVVSNRMLVTETLPLYMRGDGTKQFRFTKLKEQTSTTLATESITVEYTPDPVWYSVQALPYLAATQQECAEQVFNRLYANLMASYIAGKYPQIKTILDQWRTDTGTLRSNLLKNEELKQVLSGETPWVLDAADETRQQQNIALLFDSYTIGEQTKAALQQLKQLQLDNGAFPWFKGGFPDRYITQYILTGLGRLIKLGAIPAGYSGELNALVAPAIAYTDGQVQEDYTRVLKSRADRNNNHLSPLQVQYLYMRSYFRNFPLQHKQAHSFYFMQGMQYWNKQPLHLKAMIAASLFRNYFRTYTYKNIIPSILENLVGSPERGMYARTSKQGYYWYQSPLEQQSLLIELLQEMAPYWKDAAMLKAADDMRTWLLLNKQTNNWKTTKATADACYALLVGDSTRLSTNRTVNITLGATQVQPKKATAGTGYIKERIPGKQVTPGMGDISITIQAQGKTFSKEPSWGAVYWQYFEDLDKITPAETPLSLRKQLFVEKTTANGKVLLPVAENDELHIGDKVIIRTELRSDRNMEYLHLKDMRAAAMEPLNVLSGFRWQDGLGYYESTKDASTDFFISYLPKGTYVFEYPVYITHPGNFSVGVANIQCMYAPEFSSHSEGIRINVSQ